MTHSLTTSTPVPFVLSGPGDKSRAFLAASRHTRRVRVLRRSIVVGAILLVAAVTLVAVFDPLGKVPAGLSVEHVDLDGSKVTMSHPKLAGYHNDGRPYEITASSAVQDVKVPNVFQLHDMDAHLTMSDKTVTHVTASIGTYDGTKETMNLTSAVHIMSDSGLDMRAEDAVVQFKSGAVTTDKPVTVAMQGSTISADAMTMSDGFRQVTFTGHVKTSFVPRPDGTIAPQAAPATTP